MTGRGSGFDFLVGSSDITYPLFTAILWSFLGVYMGTCTGVEQKLSKEIKHKRNIQYLSTSIQVQVQYNTSSTVQVQYLKYSTSTVLEVQYKYSTWSTVQVQYLKHSTIQYLKYSTSSTSWSTVQVRENYFSFVVLWLIALFENGKRHAEWACYVLRVMCFMDLTISIRWSVQHVII